MTVGTRPRRRFVSGQDGGTGSGDRGTNDAPTFIQDTSYVQLANERDRRYTDGFTSMRDVLDERDRRYVEMYDRLHELHESYFNQLRTSAQESDLRQQQRFDASQQALRDALIAQKEAVQAALAAAEKAVNAALAASDKALTLAQDIGEKWREAANEWRGAMGDREKDFMPRAESIALIDALRTETGVNLKGIEDKLTLLLNAMNQGAGRNDSGQIAVLSADIKTLTQAMHEGTGRFQNAGQIQVAAGLNMQTIVTYLTAAGLAAVIVKDFVR